VIGPFLCVGGPLHGLKRSGYTGVAIAHYTLDLPPIGLERHLYTLRRCEGGRAYWHWNMSNHRPTRARYLGPKEG